MEKSCDYILIREATLLVRVPKGERKTTPDVVPEFFDVRTGVQLKQIYPALQSQELEKGRVLSEDHAALIIRAEVSGTADSETAKVVTILELKQRKLDTIVADSVLEQLRNIKNVLQDFLDLADKVPKEERFWLAQQVLAFTRKFTGRELAELEEIIDWFKTKPRK